MSTLWGGRFEGPTNAMMWVFNASIGVDIRLAQVDIRGSIAYAGALCDAGVLTAEERDTLQAGLRHVADEFASRAFVPAPTDEDIHTAVERRLGEIIGPLAGKLHTGRSRNDQVATDGRLYLLEALPELDVAMRSAQRTIVRRATELIDLLMPGYTHLQPAQPVRFSHWLLSYFWMLERDRARLRDLLRRVSVCPLGSGALAGNAYGIDREALACDLGFSGVTANSMDAVSDRDMVLETLSWGAILGTHLSRLAEDLVIWSNPQFAFVRLAERYTTGSSIMPQKRNPDSMELVRGKAGRLVGNLTRLLVVSKGLPSTYNKDLQEDKEPLFDTLDTLGMLLPIVAGVIDTIEADAEAMRSALDDGLLATDVADYLVRQGLPFRQAHHIVGQAVLEGERRGLGLCGLSSEDWSRLSPLFGPDLRDALTFEASVERRDVTGGTSRRAVLEQIAQARACVEAD